MKKHINVETKSPITIASTLIGIVIANVNNINGNFEKYNYINKSDLPTAFKIFMLMAERGVNIRARQSHCIKTTQGSHFSVNKRIMIGLANSEVKIITGNITIAVKYKDFR